MILYLTDDNGNLVDSTQLSHAEWDKANSDGKAAIALLKKLTPSPVVPNQRTADAPKQDKPKANAGK